MTVARKCSQCGKPLRKWVEGVGYVGYIGNGYFCSLRCGFKYAVAVKRAIENKPRRDGNP
jgi:hypothetical protein